MRGHVFMRGRAEGEIVYVGDEYLTVECLFVQLAGKRFLERGLKPPSAKRSKPPKPLKLRKDKKGPKK